MYMKAVMHIPSKRKLNKNIMRVIPCLSTSNLFKHSVYECHMEATRNIFLRDYSNHQKYKLKINVAISMCAILQPWIYTSSAKIGNICQMSHV